MTSYILKRLILMIPTFIGVSLITFAIIQLAPGSPVAFKLRGEGGAMRSNIETEKIIEQTKALYGLDKPIVVQYALWLSRIIRLDFGRSYKDQRPVMEKIRETLPITLQFTILETLLIYLIAIPLGTYSATHQRTLSDQIITFILFLLYSLPSFWVAMLLIMFLGGGDWWNLFPVNGINSIDAHHYSLARWILDRLWHMVLPLFCMTYAGLAGLSRYMRTGMLDVIRQDYIRTARAYGFSEKMVVFKYAMRNSLIPIITLLAGLLPGLIGGSVIIETIFSIPGMGRLGFEAVLSRDYPLIMGVFTISTLLTLIGLVLSDVLYAVVDPRIRLE
ncbi:MAG TPA: ABC transporter permease [Candidatus Hydrogenedens sp.]|nr:ABC transporter permease [Candidatus Hydrogenedens sp.]HOK10382.1 ABC transporter permease [Candidatus Hydrogenedens sp.]HOL18771.1 ABC transporter permease [Candidatus Hydrogenedens sp.]HPP59077.1 ABC transporter permease [Candidatus Hydrogenedens sp.]